ncbi:hypothetical protein CBS115989_8554 [Aspergillus niger]|nr:hypothetical protein CBS115989_8554 [Aspergillus niger]KAI2844814.1 hypothetical protein CBS11232_7934 [Aspergillus niger]KAI2879937.1 hypothetical protein CBS115988_2076 [Aspergillus niger]KAI2908718.1 hypothetical protein CBS147371_9816 [Aspergillus niger]
MYGARREKTMANPWSLNNSDGIVILRLAENSLLQEDIADFVTGPRGSRRLRRAAAAFMTEEFQAREPVTEDNIFVTPGLASAMDANAPVIGVPYEGIEGYSNLEDLFHPEVNEIALESALRKAEDDGITVRALLVSKSIMSLVIEVSTYRRNDA